MNTSQSSLFAPEERQPEPLPQVLVKPGSSGWSYEDRIAHLQATNCAAALDMVGPRLEALGRLRLRELNDREQDYRAGNGARRY